VKTILIATMIVVGVVTAASADIICTHNGGCREPGLTLRNNGGAYDHLEHRPRPQTKDELEGRVRRPARQLRTIYN
jgi:hypothetical protein